eukprot:COSAG05_NODE_159_length_15652_cov_14.134636_3_plen_190_part_00
MSQTSPPAVAAQAALHCRCSAGDQPACVELGEALLEADPSGGSSSGDPQLVARLFANACIAGAGAGCTWLAGLYMEGSGGVARDEDRARELFVRGCQLKHGWSCTVLGDLLTLGRGGFVREPARAFEAFHRGCYASHPNHGPACSKAGAVEWQAGQRAGAAAIWRRGCDELGDTESCEQLRSVQRSRST